jgi:hypothetical protein
MSQTLPTRDSCIAANRPHSPAPRRGVARFIDPIAPNPLQVSAQILAPVLPGELRQTP